MEIKIANDYQKIIQNNLLVYGKNMFFWKPITEGKIVGVIYTFFDGYPGIVVDVYLIKNNKYVYHYVSETHIGIICRIEWIDNMDQYHKREYSSGVYESNDITLDLIGQTDKGHISHDVKYTDLKIFDDINILRYDNDIGMID
jgi:hypothetical protein